MSASILCGLIKCLLWLGRTEFASLDRQWVIVIKSYHDAALSI